MIHQVIKFDYSRYNNIKVIHLTIDKHKISKAGDYDLDDDMNIQGCLFSNLAKCSTDIL